MKIRKINIHDIAKDAYVKVLSEVDRPPDELFICGSVPEKRIPTVAIIGTRRPTSYGIEVTCKLAEDLAKAGVVVISGLALGIDAAAHKSTLAVGGVTIAVLANGLHRIYPASHTSLAKEIIKGDGALISEYPEGHEPMKHHFLARNRLVSGLADAIVVVEAGERSGTTSTVTHALSQGKDVFAVPGPITSLLSAGPNRLLQDGAHVALSAEDILQVIAPELIAGQQKLVFGNTPLEVRIIELIQQGVRSGDELLAKSGVEASEFMQALTMMELNGTVRRLGGNKWTI